MTILLIYLLEKNGQKLLLLLLLLFLGKWTVEENCISFLEENGYGQYINIQSLRVWMYDK